MSTLKSINLQHPSAAEPNIVLDASGNAVMPGVVAMGDSFLRNKIINGGMVVDQRNSGASVTPAAGQYTLDRWYCNMPAASKYSVIQSTTAPAGHTFAMLISSLSAYVVLPGENYSIQQTIEGYNVADLGWGAVGAQPITLSFWVRSSLTGTFGGSIRNGAANRSYPFTFTISVANTYEYKTVTIPGDTTGTWANTTGGGLNLTFSLGSGATMSGAPGAWSSGNYTSATGAASIVGINGATFYITGVQLERGTKATPFERRQYGQELALCQRYYQVITEGQATGSPASGTVVFYQTTFPVTMRAAPASASTATSIVYSQMATNTVFTGGSVGALNKATVGAVEFQVTGYTGLTQGSWGTYRSATGQIAFSAEL